MANSEVAALSIDSLRANDERDSQNEISPEKQTLNSSRVLNFLRKNGIVSDNVEKIFTIETAAKLTSEGSSKTERQLNSQFIEANTTAQKHNCADIFAETDETVVARRLESLKTSPSNMPPADAAKIMQAWSYLNLIREHARRLLEMEASQKATRAKEMGDKGVVQSLEDGVKEKLGDARENWDKMTTGQKLLLAGGTLLVGAMFLSSDDPTVKKIKETLMTGAKIAGGGWLLSKVWTLFTGESIVDAVTGTTKGGGQHSKFLKESFKTDDVGAEALSKSMVFIGELRFVDLLEKYEQAKKEGKSSIEGLKMDGKQAFMALDLFCNKYNLESLKKEYAKYNPPIAFSQVITIELAKDPSVKLDKALTSRMWDGAGDLMKSNYYYLASTGPSAWLATKYESWFGKKPSTQELTDLTKKFGEMVKDEKDVNPAIKDSVVKTNPDAAKKFVDTNLAGVIESKYGLKYRVDGDGYVYMIVDKPMSNLQDEKVLASAVQTAVDSAENFMVDKYKVPKDGATKKMEPFGSLYVANSTTLKYFVRYKIN